MVEFLRGFGYCFTMDMNPVIERLMAVMQGSKQPMDPNHVPAVSLEDVESVLTLFKKALFPGVFHVVEHTDLRPFLANTLMELHQALISCFQRFGGDNAHADQMIAQLPALRTQLNLDIAAIFDGDPAAQTYEEVVLAYPSFEAIMVHRVAHALTRCESPLFARMAASLAHRHTGIDIHPKATIGTSFCIDHGTGVVIGETAVIGDGVKLYQGVTIGALSVSKRDAHQKRHPTIEDHVTIYAGTTILGGQTVVGHHSIIGGNVWLTQSVLPHSKVYNKDQ